MTIHVTGRDPLAYVVEDDYGLHCALCGWHAEGHDDEAFAVFIAHVEGAHP